MDIYLKHPDHLDGQYYLLNKDFFAINDREGPGGYSDTGMCCEYYIIQKIKENKEGYFDFSKSLIDIGAEDGNYAMLLDFNKNYCFEPNKRMCCLIYTNMYLRDKIKNTEVYNVALSDENNKTIVFNGFSEKSSPVYEYCKRDDEQILITRTLDSFDIKNVGLIKTDTEGFDYFILKGGIGTIKESDYPPILFENWDTEFWHGYTKEQHDRINNFLKSLGYTILEYWGDDETHLAVKL